MIIAERDIRVLGVGTDDGTTKFNIFILTKIKKVH